MKSSTLLLPHEFGFTNAKWPRFSNSTSPSPANSHASLPTTQSSIPITNRGFGQVFTERAPHVHCLSIRSCGFLGVSALPTANIGAARWARRLPSPGLPNNMTLLIAWTRAGSLNDQAHRNCRMPSVPNEWPKSEISWYGCPYCLPPLRSEEHTSELQ